VELKYYSGTLPRMDLFGLDGSESERGLPGISERLLEPATPHQSVGANRDEIIAALMARIGVVQRRQREAGLTDAYRALHPDAPGHSWFGRSGQGYRFDHGFVTTPHAGLIRSCRYLQEPRELSITDHAAITLILGPVHSSG
jgi:hypothetical protein